VKKLSLKLRSLTKSALAAADQAEMAQSDHRVLRAQLVSRGLKEKLVFRVRLVSME
jgi:hypothetical protein